MDTSSEWIIERTGIESRHIADEHTYTSTMSIKSAQNALHSAGLAPEEIDMIIVATVTSDMLTPSVACMVQNAIGAKNAAAMDVNAACSGFVYALDIGDAYIKSGRYKNILVIGTECMSRVTDWKDRGTCILFGDGSGAVVLSATEEDYGIMFTETGSDGSLGHNITILNLFQSEEEIDKRISHQPATLWMEGGEVFKFAVRVMVSATQNVLKGAGLTEKDIDLLIPHQANMRIIDSAQKRLKIPQENIVYNIKECGNMSSASIPIALATALEQNRIKDGDHVIMVGFGGGLTWAATAIKWKGFGTK